MIKALAIFDLVPGWAYALALAALLATSCAQRSAARAELATAKTATANAEKALETERGNAARQALEEADKSRKREQALQDQADLARKADQDEIRRIGADLDRAVIELRKRPARPAALPAAAGVPTNSSAGPAPAGCTGAQLYREDGEFLAREAARAETIRRALGSCYAGYDRARAAQEELTTDAAAQPPK